MPRRPRDNNRMRHGDANIARAGRHRIRTASRRTLLLLAMLVIAASIAWYILLPLYAQTLLERRASRYWTGPITVASTHVSFDGLVTFTGIQLLDDNRDEWVRIGSLHAQLTDWPSWSPSLDTIAIDQLAVTGDLEKRPPFVKPDSGESSGKLRHISLTNGSIVLTQEDGYGIDVTDLVVMLTRDASGEWGLRVFGRSGETPMQLTGRLDRPDAPPTAHVNRFTGTLSHGPDNADLTLTLERDPERIDLQGDLTFDKWTYVGTSHLECIYRRSPSPDHELELLVTTRGQNGQTRTNTYATAEVSGVSGSRKVDAKIHTQIAAFAGRGTVITDAILQEGQAPDIHSQGVMREMSLVGVSRLIGRNGINRGVLKRFTWNVDATGFGLADLTGNGDLVIDDHPLLPGSDLYEFLRDLSPELPKNGVADITGSFDIRDSLLVIQQGLLSGDLYAVAVETGGTIDPRTTDLNMTVVTLLLPEAYNLLKNIPGINILALLGDDLTRAKVTGTLDDPNITPIPFQNGTQSVVEWLWGLLNLGIELESLPDNGQNAPLGPDDLNLPD
jgi:hypothetical protein